MVLLLPTSSQKWCCPLPTTLLLLVVIMLSPRIPHVDSFTTTRLLPSKASTRTRRCRTSTVEEISILGGGVCNDTTIQIRHQLFLGDVEGDGDLTGLKLWKDSSFAHDSTHSPIIILIIIQHTNDYSGTWIWVWDFGHWIGCPLGTTLQCHFDGCRRQVCRNHHCAKKK